MLGIGGVRVLYALRFKVCQHHLSEGHGSLLALELARLAARDDESDGLAFDLSQVRARCNFTTHTPVETGTISSADLAP